MPTLKGTDVSLSYVQCFLYLVSSSMNVFIFHVTWLDTFWTNLVCEGARMGKGLSLLGKSPHFLKEKIKSECH